MIYDYNLGTLAFSKAGRDKGELYLIMKTDQENVYLIDGKSRNINNPKKKNKKHIQAVLKIKDDFNLPLTDENVKNYIKNYKQEHDL